METKILYKLFEYRIQDVLPQIQEYVDLKKEDYKENWKK